MAKLYFRYGAMASGKSAYLLQAAYNYEVSGRKVMIAKPAKDTKSGREISSRIGLTRNIDFIIKPDDSVFHIFSKYNDEELLTTGNNIACLLIDEAQFLSKPQVDELMKIATLLNVPVITFGIRTDFLTHGFEGSDRLMQIAHTIEEMKTICSKCGEGKAVMNTRTIDGVPVFEGPQIEIDVNSDPKNTKKHKISYVSLCSSCYLKASGGTLF